MNLHYRPTVDGQAEPSIEEMVWAYFYNNMEHVYYETRNEEADRLTREYFEALNADPN